MQRTFQSSNRYVWQQLFWISFRYHYFQIYGPVGLMAAGLAQTAAERFANVLSEDPDARVYPEMGIEAPLNAVLQDIPAEGGD